MKLKRNGSQDLNLFSRRWWFSAGRNFFWLALVTVLIWVYADNEFIDTDRLSVTIRLTAGSAQTMVLIAQREEKGAYDEIEHQDARLVFDVRGSRSSLTRLGRRIGSSNAVVPYDVATGRKAEVYKIDSREVIREALGLDKLGLTVLFALPAEITDVRLDQVVETELPVELEWQSAEFEPLYDPPKASIRISKLRWDGIKARTVEQQRVLKTERQPVTARKPDEEFPVDKAKIIPIVAGEQVRLMQDTVSLTARVPPQEVRRAEVKIPKVQMLTPPTWATDGTWDKFTVKPSDPTRWINVPIKIIGAPKRVEQIEKEPGRIVAYVVLTEDDMKPTIGWRKKVVIYLPEGIRFDGLPPDIELSIQVEKKQE